MCVEGIRKVKQTPQIYIARFRTETRNDSLLDYNQTTFKRTTSESHVLTRSASDRRVQALVIGSLQVFASLCTRKLRIAFLLSGVVGAMPRHDDECRNRRWGAVCRSFAGS